MTNGPQASSQSAILDDNGYAAIRRTPDAVQVLGWYTPPWFDRLIGPLAYILPQLVAVWIAYRMFCQMIGWTPSPSIDRSVGAFVSLFETPITGWLGVNNYPFGNNQTLGSIFGNMSAFAAAFLIGKFLDKMGMGILSQLLRFPLRVEIWPQTIRIGRRSFQRNGSEGFSKDSAKHRGRPAYNHTLRIIFETGASKVVIAEVFGVDRAEGIVLALQEALRYSRLRPG